MSVSLLFKCVFGFAQMVECSVSLECIQWVSVYCSNVCLDSHKWYNAQLVWSAYNECQLFTVQMCVWIRTNGTMLSLFGVRTMSVSCLLFKCVFGFAQMVQCSVSLEIVQWVSVVYCSNVCLDLHKWYNAQLVWRLYNECQLFTVQMCVWICTNGTNAQLIWSVHKVSFQS